MNNSFKMSKGFIFTFSAAACWAISILLTKFIVKSGDNSYNIVFWETLLALPFWAFLFYRQKGEIKKLEPKDYRLLLYIGLINTLLVSLVEIFALQYTQAINYSFLIRSSLLFTILFAYLFLGEKISRKKIIIVISLLVGIYFISTNGHIIKFSAGDLLTLLEASLISFGNTILGKIATKRMSSNLSASGSFLAGFFPVILLGVVTHSISFPVSFWLILLLAISTIAGAYLRFKAYKVASASYIAMIYSFTPVLVVFAAVPLLREKLGIIQIIGGILVIAAGIFTEKLKID